MEGKLIETMEETENIVRNILKSDLKTSEDFAESVIIQNAHRLPKRPNVEEDPIQYENEGTDSPNSIIVKFSCMRDRNYVVKKCKNIPKMRKISVRTDLPSDLKVKRAKLSHTAYKLHKEEKLQTRIRESRQDVWLETRRSINAPWSKYTD